MSTSLRASARVSSRSSGLAGRLGLLQITVAGVLWGTGGVVVRLLNDHLGLSPVSTAFYRLAVAVPVLIVLTGRRAGEIAAALRAAPGLFVACGLGLAAYQALYFVAVTAVGVNVATVLCIGSAPILLTGWEAARSRRLPAGTDLGIVAVAITGLLLVTVAGARSTVTSPRPALGLLCAVASGVGYAATTVLSQRVGRTVSALPLAAITTAIAAVALAPAAAVAGLGLPLTTGAVLALAYLGPVTTALAFALFYFGLRTTATSTATVLTLLEVPAAAALAVLVLGDPLPGTTIAGGLLMLAAVTGLYLRPMRLPAP